MAQGYDYLTAHVMANEKYPWYKKYVEQEGK